MFLRGMRDIEDISKTMGFSEIQAELKKLPISPNFAKIKNPLNVLKF